MAEDPEDELIVDQPEQFGKTDPADALPVIDRTKPAITLPGDVWECGRHRILCGDALEAASYHRVLDGERAKW